MNYQTRRTMSIAQKLYEGMDIKGYGSVGLITYMRTDSTRISDEAQAGAKAYIETTFGKQYYPETPRVYKGKKNTQDAHEAIRPTVIELSPDKVKDSLKAEEYKLYKLIWERFIASQMESCKLNTISLEVLNGDYKFRASGSSVSFDGFMKLYDYANEEEEENKTQAYSQGSGFVASLLPLPSPSFLSPSSSPPFLLFPPPFLFFFTCHRCPTTG